MDKTDTRKLNTKQQPSRLDGSLGCCNLVHAIRAFAAWLHACKVPVHPPGHKVRNHNHSISCTIRRVQLKPNRYRATTTCSPRSPEGGCQGSVGILVGTCNLHGQVRSGADGQHCVSTTLLQRTARILSSLQSLSTLPAPDVLETYCLHCEVSHHVVTFGMPMLGEWTPMPVASRQIADCAQSESTAARWLDQTLHMPARPPSARWCCSGLRPVQCTWHSTQLRSTHFPRVPSR